jgi:hypothetical protein
MSEFNEKDITDALDVPRKYRVILSTDGKCTIIFDADYSHEISNTLAELVGVWGTLKSMAGDAKASAVAKVNGEVKKEQGDAGVCPVHAVPMSWGIAGPNAKKPGVPYKYHMVGDQRCFGR